MIRFKWELEAKSEISKLARSYVFITAGVVLIAISILIAIHLQRTYAQSQSYQAGKCTILEKRLLKEQSIVDEYDEYGVSRTMSTTYRPDFQFVVQTADNHNYRAQGYDGSTRFTSDQSSQQAIVDQYRVGETYPCWYDQANPRRTVLTRQTDRAEQSDALTLFIVGMIFLISGVFFEWHRQKKFSG